MKSQSAHSEHTPLSTLTLSTHLKQRLAVVIRWRPVRGLLRLAIKLFAPTHRVGVGVVLLDKHGRVLLLKHVFHPTMPWGLPGGWLDRGEAPLDGAKRELREETGLTTAVFGPLIHLRRDTSPDHIGMAYVAHLDANTHDQPPTFTLSNEITAAQWFLPQELPQPFSKFGREAIHAAVAHQATIRNQSPVA